MPKKIKERLHDGTLRNIVEETRWIYGHVKRYRKAIVLYTLLGLLTTALAIGASLLSKELINAIVYVVKRSAAWRNIVFLGVCVVMLGIISIVLDAFVGRYSAKINLLIANQLRAEVFRMFLRTDWQSLQQFHSGDLLSRINTDVTTVASSVLGWVPTLIIKLGQFIAALCIILFYDPTMALLALVCAPITMIASRSFVGKMRMFSKKMRDVNGEMMAFNEEALQNVQSIKAFNLNIAFDGKLKTVQQKYYETGMAYHRFSINTASFMSACGLFVSYLCLGWGAFRLWDNKIDFGTMVLFIQLAGYLSTSLTALIKLVPSAIDCTVCAQRIISVLNLKREDLGHLKEVDQLRRENAPLTLSLSQMDFSYLSRSVVLEQLNLTVKPHEMVAVVGPSGSGKTTLFRILLGLLAPTGGSAEIVSGQTRIPLSPSTRGLFSYVPQDNVIFSGTIADTLRLVRPDASDEDIHAALRVSCADSFVSKLPKGIYSVLRERGSTLSVGQNQRLAIARAVLADAPILLLDEVTSALDMKTEQHVLENLATLKNKTCIISTHRPSVLALCDKIYKIENTHLTLLSSEK
ncbi:MAG: ABC transporter ATP-binding protein/permease [Oscillospiraceae bacterium]|jgi:ABC-type bacteriocin/lantibiotic exporter with double-glycine peptidase domain|nr:ABC transporter ATP-binding protein/permease [Oscillospiraceae bacterium]